ncbi:MAG TPA: MarR family transcriptional regulator [Candidatus Dormibacteraeota bacterium]|nr:MarR family transcriptional regulator [Candidatus Dormibacteraeota bacterium]
MASGASSSAEELARELRPRLARLSHLLRRQTVGLALSMSQTLVLGTLLDGRPHRMSELAHAEGVALPTMTEIVTRMERNGWVRRRMDSHDRRCVEVTITEAGRALAAEVMARRTELLRARLERLSDQERQALAGAVSALDRLLEGWP